MRYSRVGSLASGRWVGLVVVVGVFVGGAASFLPQQCLWLDEATQMTGLGLGPAGVTRWLAGGQPNDTGQFRDRMPPLSYWMGWAWTRVFGFNEWSLRWFGATCVATAVALVYESARLAFGTASAWVAGLLFALSPAVIVLSVEIRAYPLFLLWSALAFYALVRLHATPAGDRPGTYVMLALALSAAVFTHFFGAVLAGSILVALAVLGFRGGGRLWPIIGIGAVFTGSMMVLRPFISASAAHTRAEITRGASYVQRLDGIKNMVVRLVNHVTLSVHRPAAVVSVAMAVVLIFLAISVRRSSRRPGVAVALTLGVGLLVVTVAKLVINGFDPSSSNYNVWMRPGLCVLLSAGIASPWKIPRHTAALAAGLFMVAQAPAICELAMHGDQFAHGPHRTIVELIRGLNPHDVAVVHDDPTHRFVFVYCPIRCELGPELEHYQSVNGSDVSALLGKRANGRDVRPVVALPYRYLVVVRSETADPTRFAVQSRQGARALSDGPLARTLRASGDWRIVSEHVALAAIAAKIDVFECREPLQIARRKPKVRATSAASVSTFRTMASLSAPAPGGGRRRPSPSPPGPIP